MAWQSSAISSIRDSNRPSVLGSVIMNAATSRSEVALEVVEIHVGPSASDLTSTTS